VRKALEVCTRTRTCTSLFLPVHVGAHICVCWVTWRLSQILGCGHNTMTCLSCSARVLVLIHCTRCPPRAAFLLCIYRYLDSNEMTWRRKRIQKNLPCYLRAPAPPSRKIS
jgi:hypothetical protein